MIRRTFIKALMASPLGFLIPNRFITDPCETHTTATSTGLTLEKLLRCKALLDEGDIDPAYDPVKALAKGKVDTVDSGFTFIQWSELK